MPSRIVLFFLLGLFTVLASPGATAEESIGSRFILKNQNGEFVTDAHFQDHFMLVAFGYSFCPDICPTALNTIGTTLDILGADGDQIIPVFISVDPERDTPAQLRDFVPNFHPRMVGLTGSAEMIARVAKGYKVRYEKIPAADNDPNAYTIDHTASIFLMSPTGTFLVKFTHNMDPEAMAERIQDFLQ